MSIEDGDNVRYNNALMATSVIETEQESANLKLESAKLELKRQQLLLTEAESSLASTSGVAEKLAEALRKYGAHNFGCPVTMTGANDCYCGLQDALAAYEDAKK